MRNAEPERFDLRAVLDSITQAYGDAYAGRVFEFNCDVDAAAAEGSPELLIQMLDKLVDNAISLSPQECEIEISLARDEDSCALSVTNSGSRLPDVMHDQLFDSLVSMRENRKSGQHLGLGLHIVRLVAEAHGGSVSARNLPQDAGVEFTIHLPIV